ncbi:MAG: hypothetical protein M3R08_09015 [Bacteroidota bacterium]|nr:hypothetical protein [Bacteroidota bacterium]
MGKLERKKLEVAKQQLDLEDEATLDQVKALLDSKSGDWWAALPEKVKVEVEVSLAQAEAGDTMSHSMAMERIKQWRKR